MYTIQILSGGEDKRDRVLVYLYKRIIKEGRFTAKLSKAMDGKLPSIHVSPVRLVKSKLYNGQQPDGQASLYYRRVQRKTRYLGWDDWVRFHGLVNRVLNRFRTDADVWTEPPYMQGKLFIRRGKRMRYRYDYTEEFSRFGMPSVKWNPGDESQFVRPTTNRSGGFL